MTGAPEPAPTLAEALEAFLATRPSYLTAAEQAQVNLLRALVRAAQASPMPGVASALPAEVVAELRVLRAEVAQLRQAQNILDPSDELAQLRAEVAQLRASGGTSAGEDLERLRVELAQLRLDYDALASSVANLPLAPLSRFGSPEASLPPARRRRGTPPAPSAYPTEVLPLEYWAENMPDFGDEPSPEELKTIVERPRVRPEDIVVTEQELARQREITRRKVHSSSSRERLITIVVLVLVLALIVGVLWVNGVDLPAPRPRG